MNANLVIQLQALSSWRKKSARRLRFCLARFSGDSGNVCHRFGYRLCRSLSFRWHRVHLAAYLNRFRLQSQQRPLARRRARNRCTLSVLFGSIRSTIALSKLMTIGRGVARACKCVLSASVSFGRLQLGRGLAARFMVCKLYRDEKERDDCACVDSRYQNP